MIHVYRRGDTDRIFSTTDVPKALSASGVGGGLGAWLVRRSMYGLVHSKGGLDLCSLLGTGFGLLPDLLGWLGLVMSNLSYDPKKNTCSYYISLRFTDLLTWSLLIAPIHTLSSAYLRYLGWRFGHWAFRKQHVVDGSFVQLHTANQVTGFNCSDLKAQELVKRLL